MPYSFIKTKLIWETEIWPPTHLTQSVFITLSIKNPFPHCSRSRQQHHTTSSTSVYDNARRGTTTASVHGGGKGGSAGGNSQASPNNTVKTSLQDRISDASAGNRYAGEMHGSPPDGYLSPFSLTFSCLCLFHSLLSFSALT